MRRRPLVKGLLIGTCWPLLVRGQAPSLIGQIRQRLVDAPVLRGRFEQRKSVQGFRHPLLSRGEFVLDRQRGMLWHTQEPFESRLILARDKMRVIRPDGRPETRMDAGKDPGFREISAMLLAFMSADLEGLAARFRIEGQISDSPTGTPSWRLQLVPRDAAVAQWITRIELGGDSYLRTLRWLESRGDATQIALSGHTVATTLAPAEIALFE